MHALRQCHTSASTAPTACSLCVHGVAAARSHVCSSRRSPARRPLDGFAAGGAHHQGLCSIGKQWGALMSALQCVFMLQHARSRAAGPSWRLTLLLLRLHAHCGPGATHIAPLLLLPGLGSALHPAVQAARKHSCCCCRHVPTRGRLLAAGASSSSPQDLLKRDESPHLISSGHAAVAAARKCGPGWRVWGRRGPTALVIVAKFSHQACRSVSTRRSLHAPQAAHSEDLPTPANQAGTR